MVGAAECGAKVGAAVSGARVVGLVVKAGTTDGPLVGAGIDGLFVGTEEGSTGLLLGGTRRMSAGSEKLLPWKFASGGGWILLNSFGTVPVNRF